MPPASKVRNGEEPPISLWNNFLAATRELNKFSDYFGNLQKCGDRISFLESELATISKKLEEEKKSKEMMAEHHESRCEIWVSERKQLKADLEDSNIKAKEIQRQELLDLRFNLQTTIATLRSTEVILEEKKFFLERNEKILKDKEAQLNDILDKIGGEELDENIKQEFLTLSEKLDEIAVEYFLRELPADSDFDKIFNNIQRQNFMATTMSIPVSNTPASKQLRMYFAQGLIADCLCKVIFQEPNVVRSGIFPKDALDRLKDRPFEEGVMRTLIQSIYFSDEKEQRGNIITVKVKELGTILNPLLPSVEQRIFQQELQGFLETAAGTWDRSQRKACRIRADMNTAIGEWEPSQLPLISDINSEFDSAQNAVIMWGLLPHVYLDAEEISTLVFGRALWSDEMAVIDGKKEAREQAHRTRLVNGTRLNGSSMRRRQSVSIPSGASLPRARESIGSSPPGHGSSGRSFSQRKNQQEMQGRSPTEVVGSST